MVHHEYPFLLFLSVLHILRRLVTRLDVSRYEVNRRCQIVLGCVVLAFSKIPSEVRQDVLTNVKLQTTTPSQSRSSRCSPKRGKYQSMFAGSGHSRFADSRCGKLIGVLMEERKRRGFDNHVHRPWIRRPSTVDTVHAIVLLSRARHGEPWPTTTSHLPFLSNYHLLHRATSPIA